jgi:hypothetical protein
MATKRSIPDEVCTQLTGVRSSSVPAVPKSRTTSAGRSTT